MQRYQPCLHTPGVNDINSGTVNLTLTANGNGVRACANDIDANDNNYQYITDTWTNTAQLKKLKRSKFILFLISCSFSAIGQSVLV